jgi:hypothetical protein
MQTPDQGPELQSFQGLPYHAMTSKVVRKMDLDVWQQNIVPRS